MLTTWLKYWHNALVDIDRQSAKVEDDTSVVLPFLQADPLRKFYAKLHKKLLDEGSVTEELEPLEVSISTFALSHPGSSNYRTAHRHPKILYPFWIPARLTKTGQFMPPEGSRPAVPWLVRDALEPTIKDIPVLATIKQVDQILATWKWQFDGWEIYRDNAEAFLAEVTSLSGWRKYLPQLGGWTTKPGVVITNCTLLNFGYKNGAARPLGFRHHQKPVPPREATLRRQNYDAFATGPVRGPLVSPKVCGAVHFRLDTAPQRAIWRGGPAPQRRGEARLERDAHPGFLPRGKS